MTETREIALTRGYSAIVDAEDFDRLVSQKCSWHAAVKDTPGLVYARAAFHWKDTTKRGGWKHKTVFMHRMILDVPVGLRVDHINGNGLDNRRANLRLCTVAQNAANVRRGRLSPTGYRGVRKWRQRYQAILQSRCLGSFATSEEAALAYDLAKRTLFGSFAFLNFPAVAESPFGPEQSGQIIARARQLQNAFGAAASDPPGAR